VGRPCSYNNDGYSSILTQAEKSYHITVIIKTDSSFGIIFCKKKRSVAFSKAGNGHIGVFEGLKEDVLRHWAGLR
jgi:hypothetical protein